eukprot:Pgem_evm1s10050
MTITKLKMDPSSKLNKTNFTNWEIKLESYALNNDLTDTLVTEGNACKETDLTKKSAMWTALVDNISDSMFHHVRSSRKKRNGTLDPRPDLVWSAINSEVNTIADGERKIIKDEIDNLQLKNKETVDALADRCSVLYERLETQEGSNTTDRTKIRTLNDALPSTDEWKIFKLNTMTIELTNNRANFTEFVNRAKIHHKNILSMEKPEPAAALLVNDKLNNKKKCGRCNSTSHTHDECWAKELKCNK